MKFFKAWVLLLFVFTIAACTTAPYSTKKGNYLKQSKTLHPIVIPPGANAPVQKPYYSVPPSPTHITAGHPPSQRPPGLQ